MITIKMKKIIKIQMRLKSIGSSHKCVFSCSFCLNVGSNPLMMKRRRSSSRELFTCLEVLMEQTEEDHPRWSIQSVPEPANLLHVQFVLFSTCTKPHRKVSCCVFHGPNFKQKSSSCFTESNFTFFYDCCFQQQNCVHYSHVIIFESIFTRNLTEMSYFWSWCNVMLSFIILPIMLIKWRRPFGLCLVRNLLVLVWYQS